MYTIVNNSRRFGDNLWFWIWNRAWKAISCVLLFTIGPKLLHTEDSFQWDFLCVILFVCPSVRHCHLHSCLIKDFTFVSTELIHRRITYRSTYCSVTLVLLLFSVISSLHISSGLSNPSIEDERLITSNHSSYLTINSICLRLHCSHETVAIKQRYNNTFQRFNVK